jgi:hypothetical protein
MAFIGQIRLAQLTGSLVDIKNEGVQYIAPSAAASLTGSDLQDVLGAMAGAIQRIHGAASNEVFNAAAGTFYQHMLPGTDDSYDLGSSSAAWQDLFLEGDITLTDAGTVASSAGAMTLTSAAAATWSTSAGALTLNGTNGLVLQEGGAAILGISDTRAITVQNATTVDIDGSGAISLNSSAAAINIGNDDVDQAINIGTDGTRTITIGEAADSTISIKSLGGTFTLDGTGQTVDINSAALDIDASGAVTIDGSGTVSIDGADDMNFSIATGGGDAKDLTISSTGGGDSSILINSAGTGADAISLDVSAGSMVVAPSLADGQTLKLGKNGAVEMVFTPHGTPANEKVSLTNTAGTADDAISLVATAGGVKVQAGDDSLHLDADGTDADALNIDSAGGMDVDVAGVLDIAAGDDSVIAVTTAAKDLALTVSGGGAQVLQLNSAGTGADAIDINATAGGIDIDAPAAKDIDISGGQVLVSSKDDAASAIALTANVGTSETIVVTNTQGTAAGAISLVATAGGVLIDQDSATKKIHLDSEGAVDIDAVAGISIDCDGAAANFTVTADAGGEDLTISQDGSVDASVHISSAGTADDALTISTSAGGMDITVAGAAAGEDLDISCNQEIRITSTSDAAEAIILEENGGSSGTIKLYANQGEVDGSAGAGSILLASDAGGIGLSWADGKDLWAEGGSMMFVANEDKASCIQLHADAGSSQTIHIVNDEGTAAGEGSAAIQLLASVGGVGIKSNLDNANAVRITADGGTSATMVVHNDQGTSPGSINLVSDAGGLMLDAGTSVTMSGSTGIAMTGSVSFSSDGSMTSAGGGASGNMLFAKESEFATFRNKSIFSAATTVIGALNALATAAGGGVIGKNVVSASVSANAEYSLNFSAASGEGGYTSQVDLTEADLSNTDVFVNGQKLLSGGHSGNSNTTGDYFVSGFSKPGVLRFAFALQPDDILVVKTTSEQS